MIYTFLSGVALASMVVGCYMETRLQNLRRFAEYERGKTAYCHAQAAKRLGVDIRSDYIEAVLEEEAAYDAAHVQLHGVGFFGREGQVRR